MLLALLGWAVPVRIYVLPAKAEASFTFNTNTKYVPQPTHWVQGVSFTKATPRLSPKPKAAPKVAPKPVINKPIQATHSGRDYSPAEVVELIKSYSQQYGISADIPLRIAKCESGYNQYSKNKSSTASGVFQYLSSTWAGTDQGKLGLSVFNADANVKAAVSYIAVHKSTSPWNASKHCWGA